MPPSPQGQLQTRAGEQQPSPACLPRSRCHRRHSEQRRGSFPLPPVPARSQLGHQPWLASPGGLLTIPWGSVRPAGPRCRLPLPSLLSALAGQQRVLPCAVLQELADPAGAPTSLSKELPGSHLLTTAAPRSCPTLRVPFLMVGFVQTRLEPLDTTAIIQVINNRANEFHYARPAAQSAPGQPGPRSICLGAWVSSPSAGRCQHTSLLPFTIFFVIYGETSDEGLEAARETGSPPQANPLSSRYQVSFQPPRLQASPSSRAGCF